MTLDRSRASSAVPGLHIAVVAAVVTVLVAVGCTGATTTRRPGKTPEGACDANALPACVIAIDDALDRHEDPSAAVRAYATARSTSGDETLSKLLDAMESSTDKAFAIDFGGGKLGTKNLVALTTEAKLGDAPFASARLLLALGKTAKATFVVGRGADGLALRAYPSDPLAPFGAGFLPIVIDGDVADLDAEAAAEAALARAAAGGAAFDYVTLADGLDAVDGYAAAHPGYGAGTLRARVFSAFVQLWKAFDAEGPPPQKPGPAPEPTDVETPYYDLLRLRTEAGHAEWARRGARIIAATPEPRRNAMTAIFAETPPCGYELPPTIETAHDLVFAGLVGRALLPTGARDAMGRVPIEKWYPEYSAFVKTVSVTETTYLFPALLVQERGGSAGIVPTGSEAHRIVANLATKHARALEKLALARPGRVGMAQAPFLIAPGNTIDEELRKATLDLAQTIARSGLNDAESAGDILLALFTSVMTGFDLPGDMRAAHLGAVQSVFTAKLKGDLATKTGWGVALLFALDGGYRLAFDQSPNVGQTASEITRALEGDPTIVQPAAAHLVGAVARYVTLAVRGELGPAQPKTNTMRPERATAKAALEKALSELGAAANDDTFVRDVTELADASLTTLANTLASALQTTPTASSDAGCPNDVEPLDPKTKNALPPLRDLRNKVMANAAWKAPASPRAKRLKVAVLAISDILDVIEDNGEHKRKFAIGAEDARAILHGALDEWVGEPGLVNTIIGAYGLTRGYGEHGKEYFGSDATFDIRTLLGGLGDVFKGEGIEGALLLSKLLPSRDATKTEDLLTSLVKVARSLYDEKKPDEADMLLLGAFVVGSLTDGRAGPEAEELAAREQGSVGWVMKIARVVADVRDGTATDPNAFKAGVAAATGAKCSVASVDEVTTVLSAVQTFREGKRAEARKMLDGVLSSLVHKGFALPRYKYVFKQETRSRAFSMSVDIGLGMGLLSSPNSFSVGLGAKTDGEPVLRMDRSVTPPDTKDAVDDAARYYVHALTILAVYDYLDGDLAAGDLDAAKVVAFLHAPSWLGRSFSNPADWIDDSAGALLVLAELAAAKDRPFLAGDLLTLVKQSLDQGDDEKSLGELLDPTPFGLGGVKDAEPFIASAKKTLPIIASHLPCMKGKKLAMDAPSCSEFGRAIALRVADALPALPKLTPKKGETCPELAKIDGFLQAADKRVYDPDKYLDAVDALVDAKRPYEATVMLTRFRRDDHCSQGVLDRLGALADATKAAPSMRADLESVVVNCSTGAAPTELAAAISALDDDVARIGDPRRGVDLVLFSAAASAKIGSWEPLQAIALKPSFIERWEASAPESLFAALLFDHAATILHGDPVRLEATAPQYELVCGRSPAADRLAYCKTLDTLRKSGKPDDALKKVAADAIVAVLQGP